VLYNRSFPTVQTLASHKLWNIHLLQTGRFPKLLGILKLLNDEISTEESVYCRYFEKKTTNVI
jgi:hypothetical protein